MSSWPLNGKKGGNRKHSKIDTLPPEMKRRTIATQTTQTKEITYWDRALVAAEGDALAADLERYIGKRSGE